MKTIKYIETEFTTICIANFPFNEEGPHSYHEKNEDVFITIFERDEDDMDELPDLSDVNFDSGKIIWLRKGHALDLAQAISSILNK